MWLTWQSVSLLVHAFGKIVTSVVSDILMPVIGFFFGGASFVDLKITLKDAVLDSAGQVVTPASTLNYGNFIQVTVDFLIIAFAIFMMIKAMNKLKEKKRLHLPPRPLLPQTSFC
jgi:large conductance mechanosensitive channel